MKKEMLEVKNLKKCYHSKTHDIHALNGINFTLEKGDHLAIIGANGSGKTTLIKLITQLAHPTSGKIALDGKRLNEKAKGKFGLMLGNSIIYHRLTIKQNLEYFAAIYNVENATEKISHHLDEFDLTDRQHDLVEHLSEGMKSKVAFIRAIIHDPEILILDEPTSGVDPISSNILLCQIKNYPSVIFSSHNLYEVVDVANKVLIINHGNQVFFGDINDVKDVTCGSEAVRQELLELYNK